MLPDIRGVVRPCLVVLLVALTLLSLAPLSTRAQTTTGATPIAAETIAPETSTDDAHTDTVPDATAPPQPLATHQPALAPSNAERAPELRIAAAEPVAGDGTGTVLVQIIECNDAARAGQTDFFVSDPVAAADADTAGPCSNRRADGADYTLRGVSVDYEQTMSGGDGFLFFPDLEPGTYQLENDATGARSSVFPVLAFEGTDIVVYEFDGFIPDTRTPAQDDPTAPATASVRVDICPDAARGGDTDFRIFTARNVIAPDFADTNRPGSIAVVCRFARAGEITVILTNMGTGEQRQATTDRFGGAGFGADLPPGAYTLGVPSADGATSTSFTLEPGGFIAAAIYLFVSPDTTEPTPTVTPSAPPDSPPPGAKPTATATPTATASVPATVTPTLETGEASHVQPVATSTMASSTGLYVTTLPSTGGGPESRTPLLPWLAVAAGCGILYTVARGARKQRPR